MLCGPTQCEWKVRLVKEERGEEGSFTPVQERDRMYQSDGKAGQGEKEHLSISRVKKRGAHFL